jgi:hypothetical protein
MVSAEKSRSVTTQPLPTWKCEEEYFRMTHEALAVWSLTLLPSLVNHR